MTGEFRRNANVHDAAPAAAPVGAGADRLSCDTYSFLVTRARFSPRARLPRHYHDLASVVVTIDGVCVSAMGTARHDMARGDVVVEPAGDAHANEFGAAGTEVIIVQPRVPSAAMLACCAGALARGCRVRHPDVPAIAARMHRELSAPDTLASLALDAAALQLIVTIARPAPDPVDGRWLSTLLEYMHAHFLETPNIETLATVSGVHPAHLARAFRRAMQTSPATYLRRLRVEWAADQLARSTRSLTEIASSAGFADQSHFNRVFKQVTGMTPGAFRAATTSRPS